MKQNNDINDRENRDEEDIILAAYSDESLPAKVERFTKTENSGSKKGIGLKDILGGEILTRDTVRKQFGLIAMCVFYIILYITNRYQAQQEQIEIEELKTEVQRQKYYSLTRSGELTIKSRQSQIEKTLKETPDSMLLPPTEPPFIIRTTTEDE